MNRVQFDLCPSPEWIQRIEMPPAALEERLPDLVVFSHIRWDFVFQRPQQIMSRFAHDRRIFYVERPQPSELPFSSLHVSDREDGLKVVVPHLPEGLDAEAEEVEMRKLIDNLIEEEGIEGFTAWCSHPAMLPFVRSLSADVLIYDCMEEISLARSPREWVRLESELFRRADLVFTGGQSLYESKRGFHDQIHAFPDSIDGAHFRQARFIKEEPEDQASLRGPRVGFFGVIDDRLDGELLDEAARLRPDWNWILVGPVVRTDTSTLPRRENIHYFGMKEYGELPAYLSGWDLAMLPYVRDASTRLSHPTNVPEYLAGGRAVVSTSLRDVIRPYGEEGLVAIADTPEAFIRSAEMAMEERRISGEWFQKVDQFLSRMSWDGTCARMIELEREAREMKSRPSARQA